MRWVFLVSFLSAVSINYLITVPNHDLSYLVGLTNTTKRMSKLPLLIGFGLAVCLQSGLATAQTARPIPTQLPTTRLTIFSNGSFFHKQEGEVEVTNGRAAFGIGDEQVLKGTYWIATDKGTKIQQTIFGQDTVKKQKTAISQEDLINANIGKPVTLVLTGGANGAGKEYSGIIKAYELLTGMVRLSLTESKGNLVTNVGRITEIILPSGANTYYSQDTIVRSAKLLVSSASGKLPLQVVSLQQGMMWHPSYLLRLDKDKAARIQMKASITNTALNVQNVETDLVVGNPGMAYGTELDPISGGVTTTLYEDNVQQHRYEKSAMRAPMAMATMADNAVQMVGNQNQATEGEAKQELYYYRTGKISLLKNEVAVIPIFNMGLTYKDYYEAEIPDANPVYYNRAVISPDTKYPAYHRVSFVNKGNVPLTEAPVLVLDEKEEPLCQSRLSYVPVGGEAKVDLSRSNDIEVTYNEEEIDRSLNLKKLVDRITVRGKVKVSNLQNKEIMLKVTKHLNGEVTTVSNEGKAIKSGRYLGRNAAARAEWNLVLKPGAVLDLSYDYKVLLDN
jgi:hypothetical protein